MFQHQYQLGEKIKRRGHTSPYVIGAICLRDLCDTLKDYTLINPTNRSIIDIAADEIEGPWVDPRDLPKEWGAHAPL